MPTFLAMLRSADRPAVDRSPAHSGARARGPATTRGARSRPLTAARRLAPAQEGFLLIEVIISTLLVALIVVATLTGFDVVNRSSADQRQRNEAAVLAAQSQEQLRSDPASALQTLSVSPHSYTQTNSGTVFTVTQNAELLPAGGSNANCSITESKRQSGNAYRITSTVTWYAQQKRKSPAVVASSIITPPTGSALEIDAYNAPTPTAGVSGITATIKYEGVGGAGLTLQEQTTGSEGCVVFGGIPSTEAIVEIHEIPGYVTRYGARQFPTKEVTIAPNYTTHYPVVYNRGGAISAEFAYNGKNEYAHPNNEGTGEVVETVKGDTFVSFNSLMAAAPDFEVGATKYNAVTETYNPLPGTFEEKATSPSNLFPFLEAEKISWSTYAGDCTENNPEKVTGGVIKPQEKVFIAPGETKGVKVPTSLVTLNLYNATEKEVTALGASKWKALETSKAWPVKITNVKCSGTTPNNEPATNVKHEQTTSTGALRGGHLEFPFQPFSAEMQLCVAIVKKTYTRKYKDTELKGPTLPIYIGQKSTQEKENLKTEEVKKEEETKKTRETNEKAERKKWEEELAKKTIKEAEYKAKLKAQEEKRVKELIPAEEATKKARETKEAEETTEAKNSEVVVETGEKCP